jgi:hypothetical protein
MPFITIDVGGCIIYPVRLGRKNGIGWIGRFAVFGSVLGDKFQISQNPEDYYVHSWTPSRHFAERIRKRGDVFGMIAGRFIVLMNDGCSTVSGAGNRFHDASICAMRPKYQFKRHYRTPAPKTGNSRQWREWGRSFRPSSKYPWQFDRLSR